MIINNQDRLFADRLKSLVKPDSNIQLCVGHFTVNAAFDILEELKEAGSIQILLDKNHYQNHKELFIKSPGERETDLKLATLFRLNQVKEFIEGKIQIRTGTTGGNNFLIIDNTVFQFAPNNLDEPTLGLVKDGKPYIITEMTEGAEGFESIFNQLWDNSADFKKDLLHLYERANPMVTPEQLYKYTVAKIFENKTSDQIKEERLSRTGFKDSGIWNMLFNFQKDAVLGAIDKIEKYNGCIIADSVGLGKTFEALAIIKYYELRNDRVLVLAPKKLRDNWITYRLNDKRNILLNDRFNFDVLNHTDLSREKGISGMINLETVHWENYDLIVIDESHNFRNNNPQRGKITRYEKLMNDVILQGVKTKVLMLSATPVNTRLNDLKNQLAFITEDNDQAVKPEGINSIELTLRQAQSKFNKWLKAPNSTREGLVDTLNGDYFKLLDIFTISRSRKHIEKYYDVADIGKFPERLKPVSINAGFDTEDKDFSIDDINDDLESLNLMFYSPMAFLLDHKKEEYANKYDTVTKSGVVFSQLAREESIITLMRVNLLKRLESSIHSFRLTLEKLLHQIDDALDRVENRKEFSTEVDILNLDFEDDRFEDMVIGGKVKVLMQDLDLIKFNEFLKADRKILAQLIQKCNDIQFQRDLKAKILFNLIEEKINNPVNPGNKKVIIFSAFSDTVKYLYDHLHGRLKKEFGINSALITGGDDIKTNLPNCRADFNNILINFSPKSKNRASIFPNQKEEIDILFCTDCISEGQNLQDCDYLVNYDIHWNPVRIIQRFGRIDRIGTENNRIQLVNFYPDVDLDQYIKLIKRVKGRMEILDISTTGDENIIDNRQGEKRELDYRMKQLQKMKEVVVDLEDLEGGISISDLTFNDFKVDADRITEEERQAFENYAPGVFSLAKNRLVDSPEGVLFCLKDLSKDNFEDKLKVNLLHPYFLVYIDNHGEIILPAHLGKRNLDLLKKQTYGYLSISEELISDFNQKTKSGRHMGHYSELLDFVLQYLTGQEEKVVKESLFNPEGSMIGRTDSKGDYEIVSYLIVK